MESHSFYSHIDALNFVSNITLIANRIRPFFIIYFHHMPCPASSPQYPPHTRCDGRSKLLPFRLHRVRILRSHKEENYPFLRSEHPKNFENKVLHKYSASEISLVVADDGWNHHTDAVLVTLCVAARRASRF